MNFQLRNLKYQANVNIETHFLLKELALVCARSYMIIPQLSRAIRFFALTSSLMDFSFIKRPVRFSSFFCCV